MKNIKKQLENLGIPVLSGRVKKSDIQKALAADGNFSYEAYHSHSYDMNGFEVSKNKWVGISEELNESFGSKDKALAEAIEYTDDALLHMVEQANYMSTKKADVDVWIKIRVVENSDEKKYHLKDSEHWEDWSGEVESALKKVTADKSDAEKVVDVLEGLKRQLGPDDSADVEMAAEDDTVFGMYRNRNFFSSRDGVEDDDQPDFTGRDKVKKIVDKALAPLKKNIDSVSIDDHEKSWFSIEVTLKLF